MGSLIRMSLLVLLLSSCRSSDYYTNDRYRAEQRKKISMEMYKETHAVRRKCGSRPRKPRSSRRRRYYS
jgi:outer membrane lipoprotein SlyB